MKLALQECGRKLGTYLRRRQRMRRESERRHVFTRYIGEIAMACERITGLDGEGVQEALREIAASKTAEADHHLDDEGRVIDDGGRLANDDDVIILDGNGDETGGADESAGGTLFESGASGRKKKAGSKKTGRRKASKGRTR